jgi:hypothetical protein
VKIDGMAWIGLKWLSLETGDGTGCKKKKKEGFSD